MFRQTLYLVQLLFQLHQFSNVPYVDYSEYFSAVIKYRITGDQRSLTILVFLQHQ